MTTVVQRILDILEEGPCLTADIVAELGLCAADAGSRLNVLYRQGRLTRHKYHIEKVDSRREARVERWVYSLKEHDGWWSDGAAKLRRQEKRDAREAA